MGSSQFEVAPGVFMSARCHHRAARGPAATGACGSCYARAVEALRQVQGASFASDAQEIATAALEAMTAEAPPSAKGPHRG